MYAARLMSNSLTPKLESANEKDTKAEYETPVLTDFGSVAEITQGDSGTAMTDNVLYS